MLPAEPSPLTALEDTALAAAPLRLPHRRHTLFQQRRWVVLGRGVLGGRGVGEAGPVPPHSPTPVLVVSNYRRQAAGRPQWREMGGDGGGGFILAQPSIPPMAQSRCCSGPLYRGWDGGICVCVTLVSAPVGGGLAIGAKEDLICLGHPSPQGRTTQDLLRPESDAVGCLTVNRRKNMGCHADDQACVYARRSRAASLPTPAPLAPRKSGAASWPSCEIYSRLGNPVTHTGRREIDRAYLGEARGAGVAAQHAHWNARRLGGSMGIWPTQPGSLDLPQGALWTRRQPRICHGAGRIASIWCVPSGYPFDTTVTEKRLDSIPGASREAVGYGTRRGKPPNRRAGRGLRLCLRLRSSGAQQWAGRVGWEVGGG
ncbi:hypothetical protein BT67DRAFT_175628 [Trichocladium antarcticum]|uniref:Uncharacterized protein n=1 Tax=Trichocladium antarcticum TaxID=1450529 RepID=A0AAN6UPB3_9PEZI|nr:hypothetical protein BT67DRAFT_175628 [Trichocladium antarcticum]